MSEQYNIMKEFVENDIQDFSENEKRDIRDIKKSIRIEQRDYGVTVVAVATCQNNIDKNTMLEIPAYDGEPLVYDAYDTVRDCFHVMGVSYHEIGTIPVSYVASFEEVPWEENIPLPPAVIRKYMNETQRKFFDNWRNDFKSPNFSIMYIQMLNVH